MRVDWLGPKPHDRDGAVDDWRQRRAEAAAAELGEGVAVLSQQDPLGAMAVRETHLLAIAAWVIFGEYPGHFLQAVFRNDLGDAVARADSGSMRALKVLHMLLYNYAPSGCFGSPEEVLKWHQKGGLLGLAGGRSGR